MTDDTRTDDTRDEINRGRDELTTKDLAEAGERRSRAATNERIIEAGPVPAEYQSEYRSEYQREAQASVSAAGTAAARAKMEEDLGPLFPSAEANDLRAKWDAVQGRFVDEPRQAVEEADRLIATTMQRLAEIFAEERQKLERQWDRGNDVSTEDLRLGLRRYRSFFSRLLKV